MLRPLEALYLILGIGIVVHGTADHGLTVTELGAAMFFLGLVPIGRADKAKHGDDPGLISKVVAEWLKQQKRGHREAHPDRPRLGRHMDHPMDCHRPPIRTAQVSDQPGKPGKPGKPGHGTTGGAGGAGGEGGQGQDQGGVGGVGGVGGSSVSAARFGPLYGYLLASLIFTVLMYSLLLSIRSSQVAGCERANTPRAEFNERSQTFDDILDVLIQARGGADAIQRKGEEKANDREIAKLRVARSRLGTVEIPDCGDVYPAPWPLGVF